MKRERKKPQIDERKKRLLVYLSLLAAAVFIGIFNREGLWLAVGLGAGILIALVIDLAGSRRKSAEKPSGFSTKNSETVENEDKEAR